MLLHVAARWRKRRHTSRRRGRRSLAATALVVIGVVFASIIVAGGVGATVAVSDILKGVDLKTMKAHYPGVTTKISDRNGNLLAQIPSLQNRTPVPYGQISPWLKIANGRHTTPNRRRYAAGVSPGIRIDAETTGEFIVCTYPDCTSLAMLGLGP